MRHPRMGMLISIVVCAGLAAPALAVPTRITVRVLSKDAKFVGTSMGGARVVIRDEMTGEILAQGITSGGTGDTNRIMKEPWKRGVALATPEAAAFTATLDLDSPRRIEVTAYGPLAQAQAAGRVSATQWIVPGKHLDQGDGVLLILPGFALDVLEPPVHTRFKGLPRTVTVRANLTMQ